MSSHYLQYRQQLETAERLPSGIFFHNPGRGRSERQSGPQNKAFVKHHVTSFPTFPGLNKPPPTPEDTILCLPGLDVSVNVRVDSVIAKTKLVQRFTNISTENIPEAHYTFPLYDGAAITSFRCEIGDSKVLEGRVKPKADAKREYKRAIEKMEAAALLEEHTPEVFETLIGNIPSKSVVKIEITYVNELEADLEGDGLLLTIPTSIAPRYGSPPQGFSSSSGVVETGLKIEVSVNSSKAIKKLESRNHPVSINMGTSGPPADALSFGELVKGKRKEEEFDSRKATASLSDRNATMGKDFVLLTQTSGGPVARSGAILSPTNQFGHSALMVTVKPSELFTDVPLLDRFDGEVIFLSDRSESMIGSKMKSTKDALGVFLKSLPNKCLFNLYSFGSYFNSLWETSQSYCQTNLDLAMSHVDQFEADLGGTELFPALEHVVASRQVDASSTQVILLTDGETWDTERTIELVRKSTLDLQGKIRFFALGIGNEVSHQLIRGIAKEGGGLGEVIGIDSQGKWQESIIHMLRAALMPSSWRYEINLGPRYSAKPLSTDDLTEMEHEDAQSPATDLTPYIQAPQKIPSLHPFTHKSAFFLLPSTTNAMPTEVIIEASADEGITSKAALPVVPTVEDATTIQHLAAKAALIDLETLNSERIPPTVTRRNAEKLGELYSLSGKWTSFVAVDSATHSSDEINVYKATFVELNTLTAPTHQAIVPTLPWHMNMPCYGWYQDQEDACRDIPEQNLDAECLTTVEGTVQALLPGKRGELLDARYRSSPGPHGSRPRISSTWITHDDRYDQSVPRRLKKLAPVIHYGDQPKATSGVFTEDYRFKEGLKDQRVECSFSQGSQPSNLDRIGFQSWNSLEDETKSSADIPWSRILSSQTASGTFELSDELRGRMMKHFCPNTNESISTLTKDLNATGKLIETQQTAVDTLLTICYVETHLNQSKALWDLMILKAKSAIQSSFMVKALDMLTSSAIHLHSQLYQSQLPRGPAHPKQWPSCLVCNKISTEPDQSYLPEIQLFCGFSQCQESYSSWDALWEHQVSMSHVKCETCGATSENPIVKVHRHYVRRFLLFMSKRQRRKHG